VIYYPIGDRAIKSITADDIQQLRDTMHEYMTAESVNRNLSGFRAALNYALKKGWLTKAPWKNVKLLEEAEPEEKTRSKAYFPKADREAFLCAAGDKLEALCRCMYLLGCRPSEARRLTVGDVHTDDRLETKYVRLKTFKGNRSSGTSRKFPLTNGRLEFFKALIKDRAADESLFLTETGLPYSMANLAKSHNKIRDALELDGFETYCWRHAWITDMIQADVQLLTVAKLAGTSLQHIQDNYTVGDKTLADQLPEV